MRLCPKFRESADLETPGNFSRYVMAVGPASGTGCALQLLILVPTTATTLASFELRPCCEHSAQSAYGLKSLRKRGASESCCCIFRNMVLICALIQSLDTEPAASCQPVVVGLS